MALLDNLTAAVAAETTVDTSVETLISGMAAQIQTLINAGSSTNTVDPVALQALVNTMTANASGLAAAVTANTPAPSAPATPAAP